MGTKLKKKIDEIVNSSQLSRFYHYDVLYILNLLIIKVKNIW